METIEERLPAKQLPVRAEALERAYRLARIQAAGRTDSASRRCRDACKP